MRLSFAADPVMMKLLHMQFFRGLHSREKETRNALGESPSEGFSDRGSTPLISTEKSSRLLCRLLLYQKFRNLFRNSEVRSTGLEPVPVAGHAPQTCAYADSATTA